MYIVVVW